MAWHGRDYAPIGQIEAGGMEMAGAVHGRGRRRADARQDAQARQTTAVDRHRMLAKAAGVSLRSVRRILEAHQLAPHRIRTFKLSTDPKFAEKLKDVVGLYVDPPAMRSFSRSTRRAKFRHSTAPSRDCR